MSERRPVRSRYDWINPTTILKYKPVMSRPDTATALIVERAIYMKRTEGLKRASEYLEEHGVPIDVATRVLLRPAERRKPGPVVPKKK